MSRLLGLGIRSRVWPRGTGRVALAGLLTLLVIPLTGVLLHRLPDILAVPAAEGSTIWQISGIGTVMALSAALAWTGILPLMLIGSWLLSRGWGGLLTFMAIGMTIGSVSLFVVGTIPNVGEALAFGLSGLFYATVFRVILSLVPRRTGGTLPGR